MKKVLAILMALAMIAALVACGNQPVEPGQPSTGDQPAAAEQPAANDPPPDANDPPPDANDEPRVIRIAWFDDTLDQTRAVMLEAVEDRIAFINSERSDVVLELAYYEAQANVNTQIGQVETGLLLNPDVAIFSCVDTVGSIPAVEMIHDAGIPIVDIRDMGRPDLISVIFYGADEATYAAAMTEWLTRHLEADPELVFNAGLIYGAAAQIQQFARCDLVKSMAEEMSDRVIVLEERHGNWQTELAMNIMEDWIQSRPEMNLVVAANDIMAQGASHALTAAQRIDEVILTGVDLTDEGVALIQEGRMSASVGARLQDYGLMVDVALGLVLGTFTDPTYTIQEVYVIDATNVQDFINGTIKPFFS